MSGGVHAGSSAAGRVAGRAGPAKVRDASPLVVEAVASGLHGRVPISSQGQPAASVGAERVQPERVEALDILRGLMALFVAVYHLGVWTRAFEGGARSAVVVLGVYSVEGFFLISGFCFFHLYAGQRFDQQELTRFHIKRFFRIA